MARRAEKKTPEQLRSLKESLLTETGPFTLTDTLRRRFFDRSPLKTLLKSYDLDIKQVFPQLLSAVRAKNLLTRFSDFFEQMSKESETITKILGYISDAAKENLEISDLFPGKDSTDPLLTNRRDLVGILLEEILKDPELNRQFMKAIDQYVRAATQSRLAEIYSARERNSIVSTDITIIGDGPAAINAAMLLSATNQVTLIWNGERIGGIWRDRELLNINSSARPEKPGAPRLPLVGNATPISPDGYFNAVQLSNLLSGEDLTIECDIPNEDGTTSTRRYLRGSALGQTLAVEAVSRAEFFLANQEVDLTNIQELPTGESIIRFTDKETGKEALLKQKILLVMTGPGKEICRIPGPSAQELFQQLPSTIAQIIKEMKQAYQNNERYVMILPRVLSLTAIQALHGCWINDLNRDPEYYPFYALQQKNAEIAVIGGKDTALSMAQFLDGSAPAEAYLNKRLTEAQQPKNITLYNVAEETPEDFGKKERPRYGKKVFTEENKKRIRTIKAKVREIESFGIQGRSIGLDIIDFDRKTRTFDFAIVSTGLEELDLESVIPDSLLYLDGEGYPVARRNAAGTIFVEGTAARLLPNPIRRAIELLGIDENLVALWGKIPEILRATWSQLRDFECNENYVKDILYFIVNQRNMDGTLKYPDLRSIQSLRDLILAAINPEAVTNLDFVLRLNSIRLLLPGRTNDSFDTSIFLEGGSSERIDSRDFTPLLRTDRRFIPLISNTEGKLLPQDFESPFPTVGDALILNNPLIEKLIEPNQTYEEYILKFLDDEERQAREERLKKNKNKRD